MQRAAWPAMAQMSGRGCECEVEPSWQPDPHRLPSTSTQRSQIAHPPRNRGNVDTAITPIVEMYQ